MLISKYRIKWAFAKSKNIKKIKFFDIQYTFKKTSGTKKLFLLGNTF